METSEKRRQRMNGRMHITGLAIVLSALVIGGCANGAAQPSTGLANPASVYCEEQGYTLEMRADDNGTIGVCIFPDGSECEEWAFYRGECKPTSAGAAETTAAETQDAETVAQPTLVPSPTVEAEQPASTPPSDRPDDQDEGWLVYTNDVYGYRLSYPPSTTITERGPLGFPTDELPEGMSVDDYIAQLQEMYTDKLCVRIQYELGYINITAPPNADGKYGPCGRTGVAYEIIDRSETVVVGGQSYLAKGLEETGPGETLNYHNETLWIRLADGTQIEYGAAHTETATYEDYLETTKKVLLQMLGSFQQIPAANPPATPPLPDL
jgi:putative hemolysin